ncbi:Replication factor C, subunit RFC4 [Microbotryomycetes sp. JL221]|nr:Replication factor C, subunit RFC4 [Microbotryomycetes sp. JL221]
MKANINKTDQQNHQSATVAGGLKGGAIALGLGVVAAGAAARFRVGAWQQLTLPLKAFAVSSATTAGFIIGADHSSREYELSKYKIGSGTALERESHAAIRREQAAGIYAHDKPGIDKSTLTTSQALVEWGKEHRYGAVFAAWAASMVGSFGYISMTPLTFAQKLVQARMVAQGLTVAVLIASAGLTAIPSAGNDLTDDQIKRDAREDSMYKWKKDSPHAAQQHRSAE